MITTEVNFAVVKSTVYAAEKYIAAAKKLIAAEAGVVKASKQWDKLFDGKLGGFFVTDAASHRKVGKVMEALDSAYNNYERSRKNLKMAEKRLKYWLE